MRFYDSTRLFFSGLVDHLSESGSVHSRIQGDYNIGVSTGHITVLLGKATTLHTFVAKNTLAGDTPEYRVQMKMSHNLSGSAKQSVQMNRRYMRDLPKPSAALAEVSLMLERHLAACPSDIGARKCLNKLIPGRSAGLSYNVRINCVEDHNADVIRFVINRTLKETTNPQGSLDTKRAALAHHFDQITDGEVQHKDPPVPAREVDPAPTVLDESRELPPPEGFETPAELRRLGRRPLVTFDEGARFGWGTYDDDF